LAGIPSITSAGLDVALDAFYDKALSDSTVQALHSAGVKVKFLQGVETDRQRKARQRAEYVPPITDAPRTRTGKSLPN
jgi:hypothetical protein